IIEDRGEPAFRFAETPTLPPGIIFHLIALDPAYAEIMAGGMGEIEPGDSRWRCHREAFGKADACRPLRVEEVEQRALLGVIRLGRIAGGRPDAAIFFGNQFFRA